MKIFLMVFPLLVIATISAVAQESNSLTDKQIATVVEASNKTRGNTNFWRSDELGLIFGYDERWKIVNPSQKFTAVVINWKSRKSGGLMATCNLEVLDAGIGKLKPDEIRRNAKQIADGILQNGRLRDPTLQLVNWRLAIQDNHPVVYIERDMTSENLNTTFQMRVYSIVTSWRGREINMECASTIPVAMPELAGVVERPIKKILGNLQFVRQVQ